MEVIIIMAGRPDRIWTEEELNKIRVAAGQGLSTPLIAAFCKIPRSTMYDYLKVNTELADEIKYLQENPRIKARLNINAKISSGDLDTSKWYLERTDEDFNPKLKTEGTIKLSYEDQLKEMSEVELEKLLLGSE